MRLMDSVIRQCTTGLLLALFIWLRDFLEASGHSLAKAGRGLLLPPMRGRPKLDFFLKLQNSRHGIAVGWR